MLPRHSLPRPDDRLDTLRQFDRRIDAAIRLLVVADMDRSFRRGVGAGLPDLFSRSSMLAMVSATDSPQQTRSEAARVTAAKINGNDFMERLDIARI
jgi:hypothetical protein